MTAVRGKLGGFFALAVTLGVIVGVILVVIHDNQASAHHGQMIANCVVALHETWAYCSKIVP